jgi:hypothetical protein
MDQAPYSYYQQSGNQVMGDQLLSATSGGHVSLQIHNGGTYYTTHQPTAPYQGQNYGPQGSYVPAFSMPAPVQRPAYVVPPATSFTYQAGNTTGMQVPQQFPVQGYAVPPVAPFAYQASNAIGMQAPQQSPVQTSAAHPGRPCRFWGCFQGEDQDVYRELCNYTYQRSGKCCSLVGIDVTRKTIATYKSGVTDIPAKDQAIQEKAKDDFHRRAQRTSSQKPIRKRKAAAKREAKSQGEAHTSAIKDQLMQPSPQSMVQQPADQLQPQAPHQGDDFVFDPNFVFDSNFVYDPNFVFDPALELDMSVGLDFQQ